MQIYQILIWLVHDDISSRQWKQDFTLLVWISVLIFGENFIFSPLSKKEKVAYYNVLSQTNPLGETTTRTYDAKGREFTATDPLGNTVTNNYDAQGNLLNPSSSSPPQKLPKKLHFSNISS